MSDYIGPPVLGTSASKDIDTDGTLAANSDSKLASQKAVKTYADTKQAAGSYALTTNPLSQFAATTSAQLAGVISDETGSGAAVFATSPTLVTPLLGTPTSGNLANCTFPTLNQNTTGSAASLSVSGQTGLLTVTGLASTNRIKTMRDAADTVLELGGSYTPTGTWTNMILATPNLGTPSAAVLTNATSIPSGQLTGSIADARLSSNVPLKNGANTFTAAQTVNGGSNATNLTLQGNLIAGSAATLPGGINWMGYFYGSGSFNRVGIDGTNNDCWLEFLLSGTRKWQIGLNSTGDFIWYDNGGSGTAFSLPGGVGNAHFFHNVQIDGGIVGTTTNDSATAGNIGEEIESLIASGSATSLTTATAKNVTSISLTAGDWDVSGNVNFTETTSTVTARSAGINTTSATVPTNGSEGYCGVQSTLTSEINTITLSRKRISIASTTTVYLVGSATFSAGTCAGFGTITARRVR